MTFDLAGSNKIAVVERREKIDDIRGILDRMADAACSGCTGMIVYKESLPECFFDLRTGFAGELLQKFSNYRMQIAIIGDFGVYRSKALHDFVRESNRGNCVFLNQLTRRALPDSARAIFCAELIWQRYCQAGVQYRYVTGYGAGISRNKYHKIVENHDIDI